MVTERIRRYLTCEHDLQFTQRLRAHTEPTWDPGGGGVCVFTNSPSTRLSVLTSDLLALKQEMK